MCQLFKNIGRKCLETPPASAPEIHAEKDQDFESDVLDRYTRTVVYFSLIGTDVKNDPGMRTSVARLTDIRNRARSGYADSLHFLFWCHCQVTVNS